MAGCFIELYGDTILGITSDCCCGLLYRHTHIHYRDQSNDGNGNQGLDEEHLALGNRRAGTSSADHCALRQTCSTGQDGESDPAYG